MDHLIRVSGLGPPSSRARDAESSSLLLPFTILGLNLETKNFTLLSWSLGEGVMITCMHLGIRTLQVTCGVMHRTGCNSYASRTAVIYVTDDSHYDVLYIHSQVIPGLRRPY